MSCELVTSDHQFDMNFSLSALDLLEYIDRDIFVTSQWTSILLICTLHIFLPCLQKPDIYFSSGHVHGETIFFVCPFLTNKCLFLASSVLLDLYLSSFALSIQNIVIFCPSRNIFPHQGQRIKIQCLT